MKIKNCGIGVLATFLFISGCASIEDIKTKADAGDANAQYKVFKHYKDENPTNALLYLEKAAATDSKYKRELYLTYMNSGDISKFNEITNNCHNIIKPSIFEFGDDKKFYEAANNYVKVLLSQQPPQISDAENFFKYAETTILSNYKTSLSAEYTIYYKGKTITTDLYTVFTDMESMINNAKNEKRKRLAEEAAAAEEEALAKRKEEMTSYFKNLEEKLDKTIPNPENANILRRKLYKLKSEEIEPVFNNLAIKNPIEKIETSESYTNYINRLNKVKDIDEKQTRFSKIISDLKLTNKEVYKGIFFGESLDDVAGKLKKQGIEYTGKYEDYQLADDLADSEYGQILLITGAVSGVSFSSGNNIDSFLTFTDPNGLEVKLTFKYGYLYEGEIKFAKPVAHNLFLNKYNVNEGNVKFNSISMDNYGKKDKVIDIEGSQVEKIISYKFKGKTQNEFEVNGIKYNYNLTTIGLVFRYLNKEEHILKEEEKIEKEKAFAMAVLFDAPEALFGAGFGGNSDESAYWTTWETMINPIARVVENNIEFSEKIKEFHDAAQLKKIENALLEATKHYYANSGEVSDVKLVSTDMEKAYKGYEELLNKEQAEREAAEKKAADAKALDF